MVHSSVNLNPIVSQAVVVQGTDKVVCVFPRKLLIRIKYVFTFEESTEESESAALDCVKLCLCKYVFCACQEFLFDGKYLLCVDQPQNQTVLGTTPVGGFWSVTGDGPRISQPTVAGVFMWSLVLIVKAMCVIWCVSESIHAVVCHSGVMLSIPTAKGVCGRFLQVTN